MTRARINEKSPRFPSDLAIADAPRRWLRCVLSRKMANPVRDRVNSRARGYGLPGRRRRFDLRSVRYSGTATAAARDEEEAGASTSHPRNSVCSRFALIGPLFALRVPFRYIDPGIDNGRRTPRGAGSINARRYEVTKKNEGRFNSTPAAPDAKRRLEIAPRAENSSLRRPASPRKTAERATGAAFCPSGSIYRVTRRLYRPTESNELGRRRANTSAAHCAAREPLALECVAR